MITAVYWLGAPGVSQLEYPPASGTLYELGDLIPGMTEPEAQALVPLGHSFEIPSVYPYGTPALAEPAPFTTRRLAAQRTGEPTGATPGLIVGGAAPQALWKYQVQPLEVEPLLEPSVADADVPDPQSDVPLDVEPLPEPELVAVAVPDLSYVPEPENVAESAPEPSPAVEPLEELPDFSV